MSWTDSEIESLITFYSSVLVSGAGFWSVCHEHYNEIGDLVCEYSANPMSEIYKTYTCNIT